MVTKKQTRPADVVFEHLRRVHPLPEKVLRKNIKFIVAEGRYVLVAVGKNYYLSVDGRSENIDGVVGGLYNVHASVVCDLLLRARVITTKECEDFFRWLRESRKVDRRKTKIHQLRDLARELNVELPEVE